MTSKAKIEKTIAQFHEDNGTIDLNAPKQKRQRKPDPMPYKVMRTIIVPDEFAAYAVTNKKEIIAIYSKNLRTGTVTQHSEDSMFTFAEAIFTGRGSKKLIIAQSADYDFVANWKPN